jgi:hypothetical protein
MSELAVFRALNHGSYLCAGEDKGGAVWEVGAAYRDLLVCQRSQLQTVSSWITVTALSSRRHGITINLCGGVGYHQMAIGSQVC